MDKKTSAQISKPTGEKQESTSKGEPKEAKEYQIDSFTINNASVEAVSLDTGDKASASIGEIHFSDLKGTPEQICQQIFTQITARVIQQVANSQIQNVIKQNVKGDLGNAINSQINNILGK